MKVTLWSWTQAAGFNRFAVKPLRSLGYRVSAKVLGNNYQAAVSHSDNKAQIGFAGWQPDYPAASDFFAPLFGCASFVPDRSPRIHESSSLTGLSGGVRSPPAVIAEMKTRTALDAGGGVRADAFPRGPPVQQRPGAHRAPDQSGPPHASPPERPAPHRPTRRRKRSPKRCQGGQALVLAKGAKR
jgi:hypothetical protein